MPEFSDQLAGYIQSKGYSPRSRIVLVEGTTDLDLFALAARMELKVSGKDLLKDLAFVPAGERDNGGTSGVVRELIACRALASRTLAANGFRRYRVVALFDNDKSGRQASKLAYQLDLSIIEWKDVFLLLPVMPPTKNLDPTSMKRMFEGANQEYRSLDWDPEDVLPEPFMRAFEDEHGAARRTTAGGKNHRDFTADGKARFHRFVKMNAIHSDMAGVISVLESLRTYLNLS